eukprot:scaffold63886_cov42-Prasinocladus_malaysianus.AAC.2
MSTSPGGERVVFSASLSAMELTRSNRVSPGRATGAAGREWAQAGRLRHRQSRREGIVEVVGDPAADRPLAVHTARRSQAVGLLEPSLPLGHLQHPCLPLLLAGDDLPLAEVAEVERRQGLGIQQPVGLVADEDATWEGVCAIAQGKRGGLPDDGVLRRVVAGDAADGRAGEDARAELAGDAVDGEGGAGLHELAGGLQDAKHVVLRAAA